jgi:MSHA biogenesis protein MshQ
MMNLRARLILLLAALAGGVYAPQALAVCQSAASGSWTSGSTWAGCAGPGGIPAATDAVTINATHTITVNAAGAVAKSVVIAAATAPSNNGIIITGANSLIVTNDFSMAGGTTAASTSTVMVNAGTLSTGGMSIGAATGTSIMNVGSGTVSVASVTFSGVAANAQFISTGASSVTVTTNNFNVGGTLTTSGTGTINFTGAGAQTIGAYTTYNNIAINKTGGTATINGVTTVGGTLTVNTGTLAMTGATTINGAFTVNGGTVTNSAAVTVNGAYIINAGTVTTGAAETVNNAITVNGGTFGVGAALTGSSTLTVAGGTVKQTAGALALTGALAVNSGAMTFAGGTHTITGATNVSGTLSITVAAATGTFVGPVTVNAGGTWTNSGNAIGTFQGGITNNGNPFTAGTGAQTFNTNSQMLAGTSAINFGGVVTVGANASGAGITLTNSNTNAVTVAGDIQVPAGVAGANWTQGINSTLNCGGAAGGTISTSMTASATGNTVNYDSTLGARIVVLPTGSPAAYYNLILGGNQAHTMPAAAMTVSNNLTMAGTATATALGALTIGGTLTIGVGTSFNAGTGFTHNISGNFSNSGTFTGGTSTVNLAGSFTDNGTFTATTGTFVFNGSAAQTITGTNGATTAFYNLTINNAAGLTLTGTHNISIGVVGGPSPGVPVPTLTFTNGKITTGINTVMLSTAATIASPSAASYIVGTMQKFYSAAANLSYFAGNNFPVGDATNYTPVSISAGTTTTAGSLTVSTLTPDHPQITTPIPTTVIDANNDVNRYWRLKNAGLTVGTAITATFTFVAGDLDPTAVPGNFIVQRYDGSIWNPTTLVAANALSTQVSNITALVAGNNDFADGDPLVGFLPVPGAYDVFESSTPAGNLQGVIQTKISGVAFSLDVDHLNAARNGILAGAIAVEVRLLDSSSGGVLDVNGCNAGWPLIQAQPTFTIPAAGRGTLPAITVANSYPNVRFQIRSPVGGPYTQIGCSSDRFAIRPQSLTITALDATWLTPGTSRTLNNTGAVHQAAALGTPMPFTLRATPVPATATNYNGSPTTVVSTAFPNCTGLAALCPSGNAGVLTFTAASWAAGATPGVVENPTANYSEAGMFNLQLEDQTYANVDIGDGTPAAQRIVPSTSTAVLGRFVPASFTVTPAPVPVGAAAALQTFGTTDAKCTGLSPSRSFTYIGQTFGYLTVPIALVTALNSAGATTTNYSGATLWHLTAAAGAVTCAPNTVCTANTGSVTQIYTSAGGQAFDSNQLGTLATPQSLGAPTMTASNGVVTFPYAPAGTVIPYGQGVVSINTADVLAFLRVANTLVAPFNANVTLNVQVSDTSETGLATNGPINTSNISGGVTGALFGGGGGIAFDSGNLFYFGRMHMNNANGSELLPLSVSINTQYYNGSTFVPNGADNCTTLTLASAGEGNYFGNIVAGTTTPSFASLIFAGGTNTLTLSKPGAGKTGALDLVINLEKPPTAPSTCIATPAGTTGANLPFLLDVQSCSAGSYNKDPTAHATFGIYNNNQNSIYLRENY